MNAHRISLFWCSLYLLVLTVRDASDTGTQIHVLVYYFIYRLHIIHVSNNIILMLVKLSIIILIHTLWYVRASVKHNLNLFNH
jgi:hypothetical protein